MIRRGLALAGALIVLILIVLGIKGCLDARKERALSDYARNVGQILTGTEQTSKSFFGKLSEPGKLSVTDFVDQVNADRSAMDTYRSRVEALGAPGGMGNAQQALELVYVLRSSAMSEIADKMNTALGNVGSQQATEAIAKRMGRLFSADELYAAVVRPEINAVLESNGIEGKNVQKSVFVPEGTKWLDPTAVSTALASVSGSSTAAETSGIHGLGLLATSIDGSELTPEAPTSVKVEGTPEVEVQVQNQGESTENGITVSVDVGGKTLEGKISSIEAGATESVTIPLTPAPSGETAIEVNVQTVPGEQVASNNKASYTVLFE